MTQALRFQKRVCVPKMSSHRRAFWCSVSDGSTTAFAADADDVANFLLLSNKGPTWLAMAECISKSGPNRPTCYV
eukprot:g15138.t1